MSEGMTSSAPSAQRNDSTPVASPSVVPLNDGRQDGDAVIAMGDLEHPADGEARKSWNAVQSGATGVPAQMVTGIEMEGVGEKNEAGSGAPNTGNEDVKGAKNDVRLFMHCCWRWRATVCICLFIPYWIGALYWDYKSEQNEEEGKGRHYSSAFISGIAAFMFIYICHHYYTKLCCKDLDAWGRSHGKMRRPDMYFQKFIVEELSRKKQLLLSVLIVGAWLAWIIIECGDHGERWQCLLGLMFFILLCWVISFKPMQVKWRPVLWGLFLQWFFGYIVLRTWWGREAFSWLSGQVTTFLDYTTAGSMMVFAGDYGAGNWFLPTSFAFGVLPTVVFFSAFVFLLYWAGVLQKVISFIAYFMQVTLGTSASESLSAAGNIFVGQTEAPLLVRPFLKDMTESELHAIMTGGFATIAGGVLAAYIAFGVSAKHLISASIMSAPAALAVSKIVYPETEQSKTGSGKKVEVSDLSDAVGPIDALAKGTIISIPLVANIAAMLITFNALIGFLNAVIGYFGERVGIVGEDKLSFEKICGWVLYPIAWLMGTPSSDCDSLGELLGIKVIVNEFVAYDKLRGKYCGGDLSARGVLIATYALCGFANLGSIGIQLGGLGPLAPNRQDAMTKVVFRAMIAGNIACFMTACVAGILDQDAENNIDCSNYVP